MITIADLNDKRILIWGYGREGKSTERFLRSHFPGSTVSIFEGAGEDVDFDSCDIVIKSPGINTRIQNDKITSQTELFLSRFGKQTVGITGTKGKSTTAAMLYAVLSTRPACPAGTAGTARKALLVGNIGAPCLDYYDEIDENTVIVFELSCHQLNNCKYSPHIAVFLNLFEDHLDFYGTRENYFRAKASIAEHQDESDFLYHGSGVPPIETKATAVLLPDIDAQLYDIPLLGAHNQFNANVVYTVCSRHFNMSDGEIRSRLRTFRGLPHRMEHVGQANGVDYYDDSISTIPEATVQALQSIPHVKTVIIGGMDRGIDYTVLLEYIRGHRDVTYIFAYPSGARIYREVQDLPCCVWAEDLSAAAREAAQRTPKGGACVLSPAAASYGFFKDFEDRGNKFRELVLGKASADGGKTATEGGETAPDGGKTATADSEAAPDGGKTALEGGETAPDGGKTTTSDSAAAQPLGGPTPKYVSTRQTPGETSIAFTGDVSFDKYMAGRWADEDFLSGEVRSFLGSASHTVVNVEGPLTDSPEGQNAEGVAQLRHCMSSEVAPFLIRTGADIWSLCNNHIMDAGPEGLRSTLNTAKAHGAQTIGAGMNIHEARRPVVIDGAGGIGMISVGYQRACRPAEDDIPGCYRWDAMDAIAKSIDGIKKSCRWCVMVVHGGEEFTPLPSPYTRERYLKYLDMGADIIVAHHPHVPMNYETVGDKTIFYSLGNFIFDTDYQRSQHYTDTGILLKLNFSRQGYSFEAMGIKTDRGAERIVEAPLPDIFEDVQAREYDLLLPLSVKAFIEATKRQLVFLKPEEFSSATEEKWKENFMQPLRSGRVPGEALDFYVLCPIAAKFEKGDWKKSGHKKVIDYILRQMQPVRCGDEKSNEEKSGEGYREGKCGEEKFSE